MKTLLYAPRKSTTRNSVVVIPKELIPQLHFPKEEVLLSNYDQIQRRKDLEHAILLGNVYQSKVTILFEDIEGVKKVMTTVWGLTDERVILKQNITLPIHRIIQLK
ncbi:MAG: hypothetical protein WDZ35_00235 [Crocinitomicaceae bacterium]